MSKLSIEIRDVSEDCMDAVCSMEGTNKELLGCMAYLTQALACHFAVPAPQLLAAVAAASGRYRRSIREVQAVDLGAIERARRRGQSDDGAR